MRVTVVGAGSFGTSLAKVLAENNHEVLLWSHSEDTVEAIRTKGENSIYLPGVRLPTNISVTHDMQQAMAGSEMVLSVVPTQATREVWVKAKEFLPAGIPVVVGSKGVEKKTHKLVCDIFVDVLGEENKKNLFFLSGPSFAKEIAAQIPTAITIAGYSKDRTPDIQKIFHNHYFRVYGTSDVIGVELGGALKNVMAIATGISDGLGMGHNSRAAIITRGLAEIARLGTNMGADPLTFMGLAGMGDLVLTCTGDLSRNRTVGLRLGEGMTLNEIMSNMRMVAEGVPTTESAYELSKEREVSMPITEAIYHILYENESPREAITRLMGRSIKFETD